MLMLYFGVGEYISKNSRENSWGTNAIEVISSQLQKELPGLRGFSVSNMKNMRAFFEAWMSFLSNRQITSGDLELEAGNKALPNRQLPTGDLEKSDNYLNDNEIEIRQLITGEFESDKLLQYFLSIGFTHHCEIISRVKLLEERLFYIEQCARGFWSVEKLRYNLKSDLYTQRGSIINNFEMTISEPDFRGKALRSFKNEYLIHFVTIEDPDEMDEREFENEIVFNIKKFILALGTDFTFIGNQHRIVVDGRELFKDTSKPMGVATYRASRVLPPEYKGILPDAEKLKELLEK